VEISAEKSVTVSKVIVLANGLVGACQRLAPTVTTQPAKDLIKSLTENLLSRFQNMEENRILARPTFLDPRLKKHGFTSSTALERAQQDITNEVTRMIDSQQQSATTTQAEAGTLDNNDDDLIWGDFDRRNTASISQATPMATSIMEVKQYLQESNIARRCDPLMWWKSRELVYPHLSKIAKAELCKVATLVPSERVFSKSGQLISDRRNRLKASNVQMVMFLNANIGFQSSHS